MNFTQFHDKFLEQGCFTVTVLIGLSMQTLRKHHWTEFSWRNNGYNATFIVKTLVEHGFAIGDTFCPMILAVCTLFSLLQLIKRFKLHVIIKRKLMPFSWGSIDS